MQRPYHLKISNYQLLLSPTMSTIASTGPSAFVHWQARSRFPTVADAHRTTEATTVFFFPPTGVEIPLNTRGLLDRHRSAPAT
jgi:hypothetical protein